MSDRVDVSGRIAVEDAASPTIKAIEANITKMSAATKKVGANFSRFANMGALGGVAKNARSAMTAIGGLGRSVLRIAAPLAGLLGAAGFGGLTYEMQRYITTTDELAKSSSKLGIPIEQLQMLRHAAKLSNVEIDAMEQSMVILSKGIAGAASGKNKQLAGLFGQLGISLKDANGQFRTAADLMPQIANAFQKNTNATTRLQLATTLFGKSGAGMINMLSGGSAELNAMMQEMVKLGLITSDEAKRAEQAADAQHRLTTAISGVRNVIGAQLMPHLIPVIDRMTEWIATNREWIATGIENFVKVFADVLKQIPWAAIGKGLTTMWQGIDKVVQAFGGWETVAPVLAAVLVGVLAPAVWSVVTSLGALTIALATNPIVLAVAAIAGAAILLYKHWEPISAFFVKLWADVKAAFFAAPAWLANFGTQFAAGFLQDAWRPLVAFFTTLWTDVKAIFWTAVTWVDQFVGMFIPGGIETAWQGLTAFFTTLWTGVKGVFDWAWSVLEPIINTIMKAIGPVLTAVGKVSEIGGTIGGAVSAATGAVRKVFGGQTDDEQSAAQQAAGPADERRARRRAAAETAGPSGPIYGHAPGPVAAAASIYGGAPGPVAEAASMYGGAPAQRVEGEVETHVRIDLAPGLQGTATTRDRGQVSSTVEVGQSMVPA